MTSIRDKVGKNLQRQNVRGFGNLNVPQGYKLFKPQVNTRVHMDVLMYEVTDEKHPDRDDDLGIAMPGTLWYRRPYKVHKGIGPNSEAVTCPTTFGEPCPICEYVKQQYKNNPSEEDKDLLRSINAKDWVLYPIIPVNDEHHEEEVHILNISFYNFQNQLKEELEENEKFWSFPDLEDGYVLNVRFTSASIGGGQKFPKANRIDFEERSDDYSEDILDEVPNLDDMLALKSYAEIQSIFTGIPTDKEEYEDVEDGEPSRAKRTSARKRKTTSTRKRTSNTDEQQEENTSRRTRGEKANKTAKEKAAPRSSGTTTKRENKNESAKKEDKEEAEHECPHGLVFGRDFETADVCQDCELWDSCSDAYENEWKKQ